MKIIQKLFPGLLLFILLACKDTKNEPPVTGEAPLSDEAIDSLRKLRNAETRDLLKKIASVEIITLEKENKRVTSTGKDLGEICDQWNLTKPTAAEIIMHASLIVGANLQDQYVVMPCSVKGEVKINDQPFRYSINAGSFIVLTNSDTAFYFGSRSKEYENYFLTTAWNPNNKK